MLKQQRTFGIIQKMFSKINFKLEDINLDRLKGESFEQYRSYSSTLTSYKILDLDYFISLHKNKIKLQIIPSGVFLIEISGEGDVWPHIDPITTVTLNYYIFPENATTIFYKEKSKNSSYFASNQEIKNSTQTENVGAVAYEFDQVEEYCSFTAQPDEAYLISTSTIHSVKRSNHSTRKFIAYKWSEYSFDEIKDSIIIL